jgi:hydroxymethylbilane synthase
MNNIRIATGNSKLERWQAEHTRAELARIGQASELLHFNSHTGAWDAITAALLSGEVDIGVQALDKIPVQQPEGLVITAVSQRENPADWLVLRKEAFVPTEIFKVRNSGVLGFAHLAQQAQMLDFRPDLQMKTPETDTVARLEKLHEGVYEGIFLAAADAMHLDADLSAYTIVELNPREFVPAVGQGTLAWLCHRDDLPTRRIFKQIHESEVSACTNVERRVQQMMADAGVLAVHCARDAAGNYHVSAACLLNGEMRRKYLSFSTSIGVAEKIVAGLKG